MAEKPNFYAIIPANVRYDENLTGNAKLLYGEITALSSKEGRCWASDSYFSELYGVDKSTVQRWLKSLEDKNYIKREVVYKEGSKEIDMRYTQICVYPMRKNECTPIRKNEGDNNTSINNIPPISPAGENESFKRFWEAYPKKVAKQDALKAFKKIKPDDNLFAEMMKALRRQKESTEWKRDKGKFVPYPATWLNGRRWEDETGGDDWQELR